MDYRFFIYKQSRLVGFDKYDFGHYALLREVDNIAQFDIGIKRDNEFFTVMREEYEGELTVKGADYTALIALENTHLQYAVLITQKCDGVYQDKFKGFFSYFDYKVDRDRCVLSFTPSVWDKYTPIYDQFPVERNALLGDSDWTMRMDSYVWPWESVVDYSISTGIDIAVWSEYTPGSEFYLFSRSTVYSHTDGALNFYNVADIYRRDYYLNESNTIPPTPGGNWVYLEEVTPGVHKWIRPFLNTVFTTYSYVVSGMNVFQGLQTGTGAITYLFGLKRLNKILEYYASFSGLDYVSDFFTDDPCPMGGTSLEWTMLQQISNLRAIGEQAVKGIIKLKDLLLWIRDTFNVYFYIDSAGDFRMEHRRYFDNGLSYSYTHVIELDLRTVLNKMSKYQYAKPTLARFEKLDLQFSNFPDWVDAGIEYTQLSILGNETKTVSAEWGTDIVSMYDGREDLPKQGWVLLNTNLVGAFYQVINTIGAITGNPIQNGRFSQANLMRDLWGWGRLLPTGNVNGVATTFDSILKLKQQKEVSFPQCCNDIDYNGLIRTDLGDGIIDSATYESKSGTLKANIIYE